MKKIFKFCNRYLKENQASLLLYMFCSIITSLVGIVFPYITGNFADQLISAGDNRFIIRYILVFSGFGIFSLISGYISQCIYVKLQSRMAYEMGRDVIAHIQRVSLDFMQGKSAGYLNQQINNDTNSVIIFCISILQQIIVQAVTLLAAGGLLFYFEPLLALLLVVLNICYVIAYRVLKAPLKKRKYVMYEEQAKYFGKLNEQLSNMEFVKMQGIGAEFLQCLSKAFEGLFGSALKAVKMEYAYGSIDRIIAMTANILIFWVGGNAVLNGQMTLGKFVMITSYFGMVMSATRYFFSMGQTIQENLVSYERLQKIMEVPEQTNGTKRIEKIDTITIEKLGFGYGEHQILKNFNLKLEKGKIYVLTGKNGAGKSTLLKVLTGLYIDQYGGSIRYDDQKIEVLDMIETRKERIGVSEQEPMLLAESLRYNLCLGGETLEEEKFDKFSKGLGLKAALDAPDKALDAMVSEKAGNFSGGEKQKISLIRTFLKDADVMILDEPTSALDQNGRKYLAEYLQQIKHDKIIILSTHDTELVKLADEEIAMESKEEG